MKNYFLILAEIARLLKIGHDQESDIDFSFEQCLLKDVNGDPVRHQETGMPIITGQYIIELIINPPKKK